MNVIFFGDSNTYGYDPLSWLGGRYDPDCRWVDILATKTGWTVVNMGQNGREIPSSPMNLVGSTPGPMRQSHDTTTPGEHLAWLRMSPGSFSFCELHSVGLSMMCYTLGKANKTCLGERQERGHMGKLL